MLNQAKLSGEEHVLLKLDVTKAFDRMDWGFLLAALEKVGFAGLLPSFLQATFATAATRKFNLTRSQ